MSEIVSGMDPCDDGLKAFLGQYNFWSPRRSLGKSGMGSARGNQLAMNR